jgi:hypothetical protein
MDPRRAAPWLSPSSVMPGYARLHLPDEVPDALVVARVGPQAIAEDCLGLRRLPQPPPRQPQAVQRPVERPVVQLPQARTPVNTGGSANSATATAVW